MMRAIQLTMLTASETTAKGTGLEKSAGKEDPETLIQRDQQCCTALVEFTRIRTHTNVRLV